MSISLNTKQDPEGAKDTSFIEEGAQLVRETPIEKCKRLFILLEANMKKRPTKNNLTQRYELIQSIEVLKPTLDGISSKVDRVDMAPCHAMSSIFSFLLFAALSEAQEINDNVTPPTCSITGPSYLKAGALAISIFYALYKLAESTRPQITNLDEEESAQARELLSKISSKRSPATGKFYPSYLDKLKEKFNNDQAIVDSILGASTLCDQTTDLVYQYAYGEPDQLPLKLRF